MAPLRPNNGVIVVVYWALLGVAASLGDPGASCAREAREFQTKPDVPCDLVKNSFCDTSGDSYPWSKLRKFVFENQGLIKRMYGYQTHYAILKEELLNALDGDSSYEPFDMYSPEAQTQPSENFHASSKVRNSVRSNAFNERYAREGRTFPEGEWQAEGQIYFDDRAEKIPIPSDRRFNTRHIDNKSPEERSAKMMNLPQNGKRSIDSSLNAKITLEHELEGGEKLIGVANMNNLNGNHKIQIMQGYAQSAVKGPHESSEDENKTSDLKATSDEQPVSLAPSVSSSVEVTTLDTRTSSDYQDGDALKFHDSSTVKDSSKFGVSSEANSDSSGNSEGEESALEILMAEIVKDNDAAASTADPLDGIDFTDETEHGVTEETVNTAAPRPPSDGVVGEISSDEVTTELPLKDGDALNTLPSATEFPVNSAETQRISEGFHVSGNPDEGSTLSPQDRSSADVQIDIVTHTLPGGSSAGQVPPDGFRFPDDSSSNFRTSISSSESRISNSGSETGTSNAASEPRTSIPSSETRTPMPFSESGSPISASSESRTTNHKDSSNRRHSNTRRPASAESRHPSSKWSAVTAESPATHESSARIQSHHAGAAEESTHARPVQATWRRPQAGDAEASSSAAPPPPPPTPSTVPTPPIFSSKKGVNACPVETDVVAPYWANNTRGEVLALLNLAPFEQYVHWEKCRYEYRQMYCRPGCRCEQQYRLHRMLAFDPSNDCRGIFSDWFRFPSGCVCKCYDLPDSASRAGFGYNRRPRGRTDEQTETDENSPLVAEEARARDTGDLSDLFFESEDDLLPLDEADDRMDDGYFSDDLNLDTPSSNPDIKREKPTKNEYQKTFNPEIALGGDPVHALYSRAQAAMSQNKIQQQTISPQRRPRPHVISHRRSAVVPDHAYDLRFSHRALGFPPLSPVARYRFQPSPQFLRHSRYYQNRRYLNAWNPQASFPSSLSNQRFQKYVDVADQRTVPTLSPHVDESVANPGSNNLNLHHLMKPAPPTRVMPSVLAPPSLLNQEPEYFFNLTSHLIRSERLDGSRPAAVFKTREPRSLSSDAQDDDM